MSKRKAIPDLDFDAALMGGPAAKAASTEVRKTESTDTVKDESALSANPASTQDDKAESAPVVKTTKRKTVKRTSAPARKRTSSKSSKAESAPFLGSGSKVKITFHIDELTELALIDMQGTLRRLTGLKGHNISRSLILDLAVQAFVADVEQGGYDSEMVQQVLAMARSK